MGHEPKNNIVSISSIDIYIHYIAESTDQNEAVSQSVIDIEVITMHPSCC